MMANLNAKRSKISSSFYVWYIKLVRSIEPNWDYVMVTSLDKVPQSPSYVTHPRVGFERLKEHLLRLPLPIPPSHCLPVLAYPRQPRSSLHHSRVFWKASIYKAHEYKARQSWLCGSFSCGPNYGHLYSNSALPDIRPTRLYGQFSLDKTVGLTSGKQSIRKKCS